jgi:hypothetical protein
MNSHPDNLVVDEVYEVSYYRQLNQYHARYESSKLIFKGMKINNRDKRLLIFGRNQVDNSRLVIYWKAIQSIELVESIK